MSEEPWSKASLRIWAGELSVDEIARRMGVPSADESAQFWFVEPGGDASLHLDDRLKLVKGFMAGNREAFESLAGAADVDLFVSWSPKAGQDGLLFEAELIELLAAVGAHLTMDTYVDSD